MEMTLGLIAINGVPLPLVGTHAVVTQLRMDPNDTRDTEKGTSGHPNRQGNRAQAGRCTLSPSSWKSFSG